MKYVEDHLFVISDYPLPQNRKGIISAVLALYEKDGLEQSYDLIDARLFADAELYTEIIDNSGPKIFWLGRNLLFERGYVCKEWKGMDSVVSDSILFYDPSDKDPYYGLCEFIQAESFDSWHKIVNGWWVGRFGAKSKLYVK